MNAFRSLTPAQAEHVRQLYRSLLEASRRAHEAARARRRAYQDFIGLGFSDTAAGELSKIHAQQEKGSK